MPLQRGMWHGVTEMLVKIMLADISSGVKDSVGIIAFQNYDYQITIKKLRKRRLSNWFGLKKKKE